MTDQHHSSNRPSCHWAGGNRGTGQPAPVPRTHAQRGSGGVGCRPGPPGWGAAQSLWWCASSEEPSQSSKSLPTENTSHGKGCQWANDGMNMKGFLIFQIYSKTRFALRQSKHQASRQAGALTDRQNAKTRLTCRQMKKARCAHRQNCRQEP